MRGRKTISMLGLLGLFLVNATKAQVISPYLFGVNAWMPDTIGDVTNCASGHCIHYGKLHNNWQKVADSKASIVRYGGIANDVDMPTHYQYLRMIDSIRAGGMEPILQVPFNNYYYNDQQAAAIVQYVNITKGRHVKYWIIGNEPNLGYSYTTSAQIAAYIKPFASAMKAVDPSIKIVGPELASFKQTITNGLTTPGGPDDITGKDANGNYYLDVFTFHTYPFGNGTSGTRAGLISNLMSPGHFYDNLNYLQARLTACNTYYGRTGNNSLTMGVTEANVNYTNSSTDDLYGNGAYSFLGGQFVAEIYGIGMKTGVSFINLWSVIEGNSISSNCGYIDKYTLQKRPLYYHFQLMAENFKGENVNCTGNQTNVKQFASKDPQNVCVMIMNQDPTVDYTYTIRLDSIPSTGGSNLLINANAGISATFTDIIPNQSSLMLVFNLSGTLIRKCEYSLATHAVNNLPPQCTMYGTTDVATHTQQASDLDMRLYPNPTSGTFTVELINVNVPGRNYDLEVVNLLGEVIYSKHGSFTSGSEQVNMAVNSATGMYLVRVGSGGKYITRRVMLQ